MVTTRSVSPSFVFFKTMASALYVGCANAYEPCLMSGSMEATWFESVHTMVPLTIS